MRPIAVRLAIVGVVAYLLGRYRREEVDHLIGEAVRRLVRPTFGAGDGPGDANPVKE